VSAFGLFALLITVTALLSYLNERFIRLPSTIGVMASALCLSLALFLLGQAGLGVERWAEHLLQGVDFTDVLMNGMLSFLLFAGALHVDLSSLLQRKWSILSLATVGVLLSTFTVGSGAWLLLRLLDLEVPYLHALLFGALITPTDPIAVLGVLKTANVGRDLESMIAGESLFNDGVGVVVFTLILGLVLGGHETTLAGIGEVFLTEAVGGAIYGLGLGYVAYRLLKGVDNYAVEALITLALVSGGYALAGALHTSGPIAMVVAGLFIGNHGRLFGMSERTRRHLDSFWDLLDEVLNALLFVLIGLEALLLELRPVYLLTAALAIPLVLGARFVSVGLPIRVLGLFRDFPPYTVRLLTWSGVRGGISIALALSLPDSPQRSLFLLVTYTIVVFSILVQGLTVGRLARRAAVASAG
jgi:CPA1 family monovalent cation:H+ antiporter